MDILHLIDRLEESVRDGQRVPFSALRLVSERRIWPILDQMRISVPDQVRRAERINRERDRIIAQAHEEAERIVALARQDATKLTAEHVISQAAEERATTVRERARMEAESIKADADEYVFGVLCQLEEELHRALRVVQNGLRKIQADWAATQTKVTEEEEQAPPP